MAEFLECEAFKIPLIAEVLKHFVVDQEALQKRGRDQPGEQERLRP
jgi:hypothetical protein